MPNLDGGHYFLTMLAPVRDDVGVDHETRAARSHRHLLARTLALLPTGHQTINSPPDAVPSPFAGNELNHLVRFALIDAPNDNGRVSGDTLISKLRRIDPLKAQPVDRLNASYLLFAAEIDARGEGEAGLLAYTDALWATMKDDLRAIFGHCRGFDAVRDAASFHVYVKRCQVETTLPFNDYWADAPQIQPMGSAFWAPLIVAAVAVVALLVTVAVLIVAALVGAQLGWPLPALLVEAACLGLALVIWQRLVLAHGDRPFPTAEGSDLPSVLKALYLQQQFTRFAMAAQGDDAAALHQRFGRFLQATVPTDSKRSSQAPGAIRSKNGGYVP